MTFPMTSASGYAAELWRIEQVIAEFEGKDAFAEPIDAQRLTQYVYCLYQRAALTGDPAQLGAVERAIERAIPLLANPGDLYLLRANTVFKLHRLADAEAALAAVAPVAECNEGRLLRADLDFQRGRYREAKAGYCGALQAERTWGALTRLAHFRGKMGDAAGADRVYDEAEDELTAKEMRAYAWVEVQRGFLAFSKDILVRLDLITSAPTLRIPAIGWSTSTLQNCLVPREFIGKRSICLGRSSTPTTARTCSKRLASCTRSTVERIARAIGTRKR